MTVLSNEDGMEKDGYLHVVGSVIDGNVDLFWSTEEEIVEMREMGATFASMPMNHSRYETMISLMPKKWHVGGKLHPQRFKYSGFLRTLLEWAEENGHFTKSLMWNDRLDLPVFACKEAHALTVEDIWDARCAPHTKGCKACIARHRQTIAITLEKIFRTPALESAR